MYTCHLALSVSAALVISLPPHGYLYGVPHARLSSRSLSIHPVLLSFYLIPLSDADDTQIFLPFRPQNFQSSLTHLQDVLQHISSWMTANLLTLNSSKTEFLLIGLKQQLAKLRNSSLNLTLFTLLVTLASYSTNISHSLTKSLHSLNRAILTFVNFESVLILIPKQPVSVQPPLYIPNLTTVRLYYNLPKSQINRLQQIQNFLARPVVKAPKFIYTTPYF